MGWTRQLERFGHLSVVLMATALGLFLLGVAVFQQLPGESELQEVRGTLSSYAFHGSRKGGFDVVLTIEGAPHRYWTDALSRDAAVQTLRGAPQVSLYSERNPTYGPIDGDAYKSYGLWIDGRPVRSLEAALKRDAFFLHIAFPILGVACLGLALLGWRRRPANQELQRTGFARR